MQHSLWPEIPAVKRFRFRKKNLLGLKLHYCTSLLPRLSHHPVFDGLQYAKMEGEAWSILSREWRQCLPKVDRGGEGPPIERTRFAPAFEPGAARFSLCEHLKFQHLGQKLWCHSADQASPSVFAYCKRSKTGRCEGLGTRLLLNHSKRYSAFIYHSYCACVCKGYTYTS